MYQIYNRINYQKPDYFECQKIQFSDLEVQKIGNHVQKFNQVQKSGIIKKTRVCVYLVTTTPIHSLDRKAAYLGKKSKFQKSTLFWDLKKILQNVRLAGKYQKTYIFTGTHPNLHINIARSLLLETRPTVKISYKSLRKNSRQRSIWRK